MQEQLFLVEGSKNVLEVLNSDFEIEYMACTDSFYEENAIDINVYKTTESELNRIGSLKTNNSGIAVVRMKERNTPQESGLWLALDGINDPGNLGTIIRTADWFGISFIAASESTVDFYNPKVINATMGSFTRVTVQYLDLKKFISNYQGNTWIADMEGSALRNIEWTFPSLVVMGSESHGVSDEIRSIVKNKVAINGSGGAESLNVAIAASLIMYEATLHNY